MARTIDIPSDVMKLILEFKKVFHHKSEISALWAIVRLTAPGLIEYMNRYASGTALEPVAPEPSPDVSSQHPIKPAEIKNNAIRGLFE